jgi:hypothetical protein
MKRSTSMLVSTALVMASISSVFPDSQCFAAPPSNTQLAKLEAADQADRTAGSNKIDWDVVSKHDAIRRDEALRLLKAGDIRTADDYLNAAVIFQHGDAVQDTQLAFALATTAARMNASNQDAETLMAQSWDRILVKSGKPQWYGTQFTRSKTTGKWELYPTDPNVVTEDQRKAMGLPTLADTMAHLAELNK